MTDKDKIDLVRKYIDDHKLGVVSTVNRNCLPQSAVVGISQNENLELIFATYNTSRKYVNLQTNPKVSVVIGWDAGKTVQYEGSVVELSGEELEECKKLLLAKMPSAAKYVSETEEVFYKIKPSWIKYTDLAGEPWERFEIKF